ncbi:MAG: putative manganese transporter [Oscillospiraceae bacterium]
MLHTLSEIFLDALLDSVKVLPFLFGVYLLIEYIEHHSANKLGNALKKMGPFGAIGGAILGVVPQCGFSVAAANLYSGRLITFGTLAAVFISTSDEAIPMLISNPESMSSIWKLMLIKLCIGAAVGIIVDLVSKAFRLTDNEEPFKEICSDCDCEHHGIFHSALHHTLHIILFIFVVNLLLNGFMELAGSETVSKLLMTNSVFQPLLAGIVGFIPNCAASVVLTQLYINGVLSFGSAVAGLTTGAGIGLAVLFKTNKHHMKQNLCLMGIMYAAGVGTGMIIQLLS